MTTFDKREEGFEKKFAHDEELKFKAEARRNKLLGLWAAEKLGITGEMQRSRDTDVLYGDGNLPSSFEWHRSDGIGLSYAFHPSLVFKIEHHWDRGIQVEQPANPLTPPRFRYVIASLSASF